MSISLEQLSSFPLFLCTILFLFLLYLDPITRFTRTATRPINNNSNMPLIINRRGGARLPNRRIPVVPPFPRPDPQEQSKAPEAEKEEAEASVSGASESEEFGPNPKDVYDVRLILEEAGNFPPEVADMIIDYAEYWACTTTIADYRSLQGGHLTIRGGRPGEDRFLVSLSFIPTFGF